MPTADDGFGSFTSFPPSRRVRFAPTADLRPMPAFMATRPTARPKTNLLKSRRSALAGCRAVRDSTLVAWYPSFTHLARDGAYDSHPSGALVRVQSATGRHDFLESGGYLSNDGSAALEVEPVTHKSR